MNVQGKHHRSAWWNEAEASLSIIDQTALPHTFRVASLGSLDEVCEAIRSMRVRGAPLIGVVAAYGLAMALREDPSPGSQKHAVAALLATRPTAINLRWALERVAAAIASSGDPARAALACASRLADEDVEVCRAIGANGLAVARELWGRRAAGKERLEFLTHCNAGWLATVDWGTALSCVYQAHEAGIPVHVWVCETRPRSQGARLTAWELGQEGVPHTLLADGSAGHLMQRGLVDLCVVGSDRTTARGDVCNKIGTYPLALAARDNGVPFYVALPYSTIDWDIEDAVAGIPIESRDAREVTHVTGRSTDGSEHTVTITPAETQAVNYGFDVTPARLVTALITERGVFPVTPEGLAQLAGARPAS
jgi:methylthioribose-1-phosphate isomerase